MSVRAHLCCSHVTFEANGSRLLDDISFHAQCGQLTAVMGPSGAGKTVLLDCLMNQVRPAGVTGQITWYDQSTAGSGNFDIEERNNVRFGYVPTTREFAPCFTVRETLEQACVFKLGHVDRTRVDLVLSRLQLQSCAAVKVGHENAQQARSGDGMTSGGIRGISTGQRKRLAIGLELLTTPAVLVVDECTTGLDATNAAIVVQVLRDIAVDDHCLVLMTIHQPSPQIFAQIDWLVLLGRGKILHAGARSEIKDAPDQLLARCSTAAEVTAMAQQYRRVLQSTLDVQSCAHTEDAIEFAPRVATNCCTQFRVLAKRSLISQWRDPSVFAWRWAMYLLLSLFTGLMFKHMPEREDGIRDRLSFHNFMTAYTTSLCVASIPFLRMERGVYEYELSNGYYTPWPYMIVNALSRVPYLIVITASCVLTQMAIVNLWIDSSHALVYASTMFLSLYCTEAIMALISTTVPGSVMNAMIVGGMSTAVGMLLSGCFVAPSHMYVLLRYAHFLNVPTYHFAAVMYTDLSPRLFRVTKGLCGNDSFAAQQPDACTITGMQVLSDFELEDTDVGQAMLAIGISAVGACALMFYRLWRRAQMARRGPGMDDGEGCVESYERVSRDDGDEEDDDSMDTTDSRSEERVAIDLGPTRSHDSALPPGNESKT